MPVVHGSRRKPRAIFDSLDDETIATLAPFVGSYVERPGDGSIDEREFDLVVTARGFSEGWSGTWSARSYPHLHVLSLGAERTHPAYIATEARSAVLKNDVNAGEMHILDDIAGTAVGRLVEGTLVPAIARSPRPRGRWGRNIAVGGGDHRWQPLSLATHGVEPLLLAHDDEIMAFIAPQRTEDGGGILVALPVVPDNIATWMRWFIERARSVDPAAFPERLDWQEDPRWAPPELRAILAERVNLEEDRKRLLADLERRQNDIAAKVKTAQDRAVGGPWRLLTEQGESFEDAVVDALETLGFKVERRDQTRPANEPRLEDLRITDPAEPDWTALAECKGVRKGAQARAVAQLSGRPVRAYQKETGNEPSALYYIVNHDIDVPPPERPLPLEADQTAIDVLTENDGAVIDSRALLTAQLTAQADPDQCAQLRAALRGSRGRWDGTVSRD